MSKRIVRAAMTQTCNAYKDMPSKVSEVGRLSSKLEDIRRANVEHHVELVSAAKAQGVQLIGFGELFPGPYFALGKDPMWFALAEDAESGPTVTTLKEAARKHQMIIVAPIYERDQDGKRFNTAVVIDEKGVVLGKYRKTHIPHGTNEQGSFDEPFYYDRSDGRNGRGPSNISRNDFFPVFTTSLGKLGVAICYDRHFEGVMHSLAREGAELVMSPAVTFGNKSQRMWHIEFPVDAARHRLFIGGSNRAGTEPPWNQPFFGESYFCGPNGIAPNLSKSPHLVIADLDLAELSGPDPSGWNLPRDIRYDIYSKR